MEKSTLTDAIKNSGGAQQPDDEIDEILDKINFIEDTGKYSSLIRSISSANDKSNFLADVFEVTFAFQFESSGLPLEYEVKQSATNSSSIDFLRRTESGLAIYLEARLLQQDDKTSESIKEQLDTNQFYQVVKNGDDNHDSIVRIQGAILSKVQKNGTPIKFLTVGENSVNIVVIEVSKQILGTIDRHDCLLVTHGDPYVDKDYRCGIFGLFQQPSTGDPEHIENVAEFYEHIRKTLSGVLFAFEVQNGGSLNYNLEHYMVWNPSLIDQELSEKVCSEIVKAIPIRSLQP